MKNNKNNVICCRSYHGVTIGLVDAIISISRILAKRDFKDQDVVEALKDLASDEDLKFIIKAAKKAKG